MAASSYSIQEYVDNAGKSPFRKWIKKLDRSHAARVQARIFRFEKGNLGDIKELGDGVYEARFMFGPGYRLYFAIEGDTLIVLLAGGDKSSQKKDIEKAKENWKDYQERG